MNKKLEKKKLTFKQLVKELDKALAPSKDEEEEYGETAIDKLSDQFHAEYKKLTHLGAIEMVHEEGGYEAGPNFQQIFLFMDHGVYLKLSGIYSSYDGVFWGDDEKTDEPYTKISQVAEEVFPQDKMITVYKTNKELKKELKKEGKEKEIIL